MKAFTVEELVALLDERDALETPFQRRVMATLAGLLADQREIRERLDTLREQVSFLEGLERSS
jgi:hypothetical protein